MDKQDRYNKYFIDVAQRTAQNSYARRAKVGAVIVKDNHVLKCCIEDEVIMHELDDS